VTSQSSTSGQSSTLPQSGEASAAQSSTSPSSSSSTGSATGSQSSTGTQSSTSEQSAQSSTSGQSNLPQGAAISDTATLQGQIQQALQNETTLSNDKVSVNVTDTEIELTGDVGTNKDKQTAKRIAQSYAGNRKVVDHLKVTGKGKASSDNAGSPQPPQQQ
jgi:osmotically-inducible protein OsmY